MGREGLLMREILLKKLKIERNATHNKKAFY